MTKNLMFIALALVGANGFANPVAAPGQYTDGKGCEITAEDNVRSGVLKIEISTNGILQGAPVLDFASNKALDFGLCTVSDEAQPVTLQQQALAGGNIEYKASCGTQWTATQISLDIVVDSSGWVLSADYVDKVAKFSTPAGFVPGIQEVSGEAHCQNMQKSGP